MPNDAAIVAAASEGIRALNATYESDDATGAPDTGPFYLLHRPRRWNAADGVWMGWERKRGKLVELQRLHQRRRRRPRFATTEGDSAVAARRPLRRSRSTPTRCCRAAARGGVDRQRWRIRSIAPSTTRSAVVSCAGTAILQPRVSVSLAERERVAVRGDLCRTSGRRSVHDRRVGRLSGSVRRGHVHGQGHLRRRRVSSRDGRADFPENSLLSHDLIEGTFARAGLVTDVEVFDDYPTRYRHRRRGDQHRWIRGDWQLLPLA